MSDLFKEFIKDVLDVEIKSTSMPRIPNPFSVFLQERKKKTEDTISVLQSKRTQIEDMIKKLQNELEVIDKRLLQLKKRR